MKQRTKLLNIFIVLIVLINQSYGIGQVYAGQQIELSSNTTYDATGNFASHTDANGAVIHYEYDATNQLTAVRYPDQTSVTYTYNSLGQRTGMTDALGKTIYEYDIHGHLVKITDPNQHTLQYEYDSRGLQKKLIYPDGSVVNFSWDADGRLTDIQESGGITHYEYDLAGKLIRRVLPNGVVTIYQYDADHQTSISHHAPDGTLLLELLYVFDANGNRTQITRTEADAKPQVTSFAYDELSRLVKVNYPGGDEVVYSYDVLGNRLSMTSSQKGVTRYGYDGFGQLTSLEDTKGKNVFQYDANGNLVERKDETGHVIRYSWDYENRLRGFEDGSTKVNFSYDGDGRRLVKMVNGQRTEYIQDGLNDPQVLFEIQPDKNIHYLIGQPRIGQIDPSGTYYFLENSLDDILGVTDIHGNLTQKMNYDVFGELRVPPYLISSFGFSGEELDKETNLLFLRARYYDPALGRFLTRDPYPTINILPQTFNRYAYSLNNPVNMVDHLGLASSCASGDEQYIINPTGRNYGNPAGYRSCNYYVQDYLQNIFGISMTGKANEMYDTLNKSRTLAGTNGMYNIEQIGAMGAMTPQRRSQLVNELLKGSVVLVAWKNPAEGEDEHGHIGYVVGVDQSIKNGFGGIYVSQSDLSGTRESSLMRITGALRNSRLLNSNFYAISPASPGEPESNVGGILLDQAAKVFGDLTDVTGATYDPKSGQLILIGQQDRSLPPMDLDDFAVAIRSVYSGTDPGVTMVPVDPSMKDTTQRVQYFGQTYNTRFGQIMFEADRYLKSMAAGQDTLTGQPLQPNVPGFKSELQLSFEQQTSIPWHRNWFVPGDLVLRQSADGSSMFFDKASIKLDSRFVKFEPDGSMKDVAGYSPVTDEFTRFVTEHYNELAVEKPELAELVRLAKIVGIVKWLHDNNIPVDLAWLKNYQVKTVETPTTTPGVIATKSNENNTFTITTAGGVDFSTPNIYLNDIDGSVAGLGQKALTARPQDLALSWQFEDEGKTLTAVALNLAPTKIVGGYSTSSTDLSVNTSGGQAAQFTRQYNSLNLSSGPLGPGWSQRTSDLSFQHVTLPDGGVTMRAILSSGGSATDFAWMADGFFAPEKMSSPYKQIGLINEKDFNPHPIPSGFSLQPGLPGQPVQILDAKGNSLSTNGFIVQEKDGSATIFDQTGRLAGVLDAAGHLLKWVYSGTQLIALRDKSALGLEFSYLPDGHLSDIKGSDGSAVHYTYDTAGCLLGVSDQSGTAVSQYEYSADNRLIRVRDSYGRILRENVYDILGRVMNLSSGQTDDSYQFSYEDTTNTSTYKDSGGNAYTFTYDNQNRLVSQTNPLGNQVGFQYDGNGNVIEIYSPSGNTTIQYDTVGFPSSITSPLGEQTRFLYPNTSGLPSVAIDPMNQVTLIDYDEQNRPVRVQSGFQLSGESAQNGLSYYEISPISIQLGYTSSGELETLQDTVGNTTHFAYTQM